MGVDPGEYIAGCYLKKILHCDFVDYNVRAPGGGLQGLGELDVVGLDLKNKKAYLCEVTTHIRGVLYKSNSHTIEKIKKKHQRQQEYARQYLSDFQDVTYMFWSPVVPVGYVTNELAKIETLTPVINGTFKKYVDELRALAAIETHDSGNIFFRFLQIMEKMRST